MKKGYDYILERSLQIISTRTRITVQNMFTTAAKLQKSFDKMPP